MLFNSYEFCLLFLPLALIVYSATGRYAGRAFALGWLLLASIVFYAWSSPSALAILGGSILLNYGAARLLTRARSARDTRGGLVMGLAVAANIAILAQFKYLEFLVEAAAALVGIEMPLVRAIPPLAISFFTFQQIAYVVDVHRGQPAERNLLRYGLFVCFFPQLIAGPIVHHKEMLPQFNRASSALSPQDLATGVTLFAIGLFKKVVVADGIVVWVTPVFEAAKFGGLAMLDAWAGTLAYTLQLYFDFSGYCDMAIGLGLMFGDYLYFGLGGNRLGPTRRQINLMLTMLLGGLWHGANWTFLIWGGLHGCYLMLNHAWRGFFARTGRQAPEGWPWQIASRVLTLLAVMLAWVFFRADSLTSALHMIGVMAGAVSPSIADPANGGAVALALPLFELSQISILLGLLGVVSFAPNSQQIVGYNASNDSTQTNHDVKLEKDLGKQSAGNSWTWARGYALRWSPTAAWAALMALLCLLSLAGMSETREFVYFRF
ncbi:MAG: MBOAT family protein [Deltaproteobacteria bacterium]|nr:MBOAT family protein [Deltaproteobacteria bacterium]